MSPACPSDLRVIRSPTDTTVRVGQSFTPTFQFRGCAGTKALQDELTFTSTNEAALAVNAQTGHAMAVAPGQAAIEISGARYGGPWGIAVTVVP